jgi:hypothetical protein
MRKMSRIRFLSAYYRTRDQEKEEPVNKVWEESFPPEKNKDNDDKKAGF